VDIKENVRCPNCGGKIEYVIYILRRGERFLVLGTPIKKRDKGPFNF